MQVLEIVYVVDIKYINFKNMPNDEEFYCVIDLAGNKRIHRCGHIKKNPTNFKSVFLDKSQLTDEQLSEIVKLNQE